MRASRVSTSVLVQFWYCLCGHRRETRTVPQNTAEHLVARFRSRKKRHDSGQAIKHNRHCQRGSRALRSYINVYRHVIGFGFLSFESDDAVNNVVSEHYVTINGKKVESPLTLLTLNLLYSLRPSLPVSLYLSIVVAFRIYLAYIFYSIFPHLAFLAFIVIGSI